MESEILKTLHEIRAILFVLTAFVGLSVLIKVGQTLSVIYKNYREAVKQCWDNDAEDLYKKGDYDALVTHCDDKLKDFPNDSWATLWLARAKRAQNKPDEAIALFEKVSKLEPTWKEDYIDPYFKNGELV